MSYSAFKDIGEKIGFLDQRFYIGFFIPWLFVVAYIYMVYQGFLPTNLFDGIYFLSVPLTISFLLFNFAPKLVLKFIWFKFRYKREFTNLLNKNAIFDKESINLIFDELMNSSSKQYRSEFTNPDRIGINNLSLKESQILFVLNLIIGFFPIIISSYDNFRKIENNTLFKLDFLLDNPISYDKTNLGILILLIFLVFILFLVISFYYFNPYEEIKLSLYLPSNDAKSDLIDINLFINNNYTNEMEKNDNIKKLKQRYEFDDFVRLIRSKIQSSLILESIDKMIGGEEEKEKLKDQIEYILSPKFKFDLSNFENTLIQFQNFKSEVLENNIEIDKRSLIIELAIFLENILEKITGVRKRGLGFQIRTLNSKEYLNKRQYEILMNFSRLRNQAAHELSEPEYDQNYISQLFETIEEIVKKIQFQTRIEENIKSNKE